MQRLKCAALMVWVVGVLPAFSQTRQVVLLYDERTDLPGMAMLDAGFARALTSGSPDQVEIYREAMDLSRFDSEAYRNLLRDHFRAKYAAKKIDVAVAVMEPALDFLLSHRDEIFPGAPIVFCGMDGGRLGGRPLPPDVTGVLLKREFSPTLELALGLHPETERIAVVAGTSEFDAQLLKQAREEFRPFEDRLAFTYLTALPLPELLSQLSRLPPKTIVLYSTVFRDGAGKSFVPHEVAERVSAAANAPVYGFVDQYLGRGIVGGRLYSLGPHGEAAAGLVLKILNGTKPSELPLIEPVSSVTAFDWQQLQRWGIDESRLPSGANIRFRPASLWREYKYYVIGGLLVLFAQTMTIVALVGHRARRRRAERSLVESESRFQIAADAALVMIWMSGVDKLCTFLNKPWLEFTGRTLDQDLGSGWTECVHPEDLQKCSKTYAEAFDARQPFVMEYRLRRHDGEYRWISDAGRPRHDNQGNFAGYIGTCLDITQRKQAEQTLHEFAGRLLHAQEAERARLARELHDDITQRLALLAIDAGRVERAGAGSGIGDTMRGVREGLVRLSEDVHTLSYRLHSSLLDDLGLAEALKVECEQFARQESIPCDVRLQNLPEGVSRDTALGLFRVTQEALRNIARHAQARMVDVTLRSLDDGLQLAVHDDGIGFDAAHKPNRTSLGLSSMSERMRLLDGELDIESAPGQGTTVVAWVPLNGKES